MPIVLKFGRLNLLEPSGPVQTYNGIALAFRRTELQTTDHRGMHKIVTKQLTPLIRGFIIRGFVSAFFLHLHYLNLTVMMSC